MAPAGLNPETGIISKDIIILPEIPISPNPSASLRSRAARSLPLMVHFHGGDFIICTSADTLHHPLPQCPMGPSRRLRRMWTSTVFGLPGTAPALTQQTTWRYSSRRAEIGENNRDPGRRSMINLDFCGEEPTGAEAIKSAGGHRLVEVHLPARQGL